MGHKISNEDVRKSSSAEKFVDHLLTEGVKQGFKAENLSHNYDLPPFYDEKLFRKGQQFFNNHIFAMFFAKMHGLLAILSIPTVLKILMLTKKSSSNFSAYIRYMSTVFHMVVWYRNDFQPASKLWKSLSEVTKKHSFASKQSCALGFSQITQKDMALTQFAFMGFQIARSELIGIHYANEEELKGFVHLWRVVGYLMGIEDRFNICGGSVAETKEICNILIYRCFYPEIKKKNPDYIKMSSHLISGMWSMSPFLLYTPMMNYLYNVLLRKDYKSKNENNNILTNEPYFKLNYLMLWMFNFYCFAVSLCKYNIARLTYNYLKNVSLWLMEVFPFLAYYQFGKDKSIVKLKL